MLIGTSGVGRAFTKEVVEAMASINEVISILNIAVVQVIISGISETFE